MTRLSALPPTRYITNLSQKSDAARCPKCLGAGALVLMPDLPGQATVESCPICEGTGLRPRPNGYFDYTPATISNRPH